MKDYTVTVTVELSLQADNDEQAQEQTDAIAHSVSLWAAVHYSPSATQWVCKPKHKEAAS